jgi:hypothetical protein
LTWEIIALFAVSLGMSRVRPLVYLAAVSGRDALAFTRRG